MNDLFRRKNCITHIHTHKATPIHIYKGAQAQANAITNLQVSMLKWRKT